MTYPYPTDPPPPPSGVQPLPPMPPMPNQGVPTAPVPYPFPVPQPWAQATPVLTYQVTDRVEKGVSQMPLISMIAGIVTFPFLCSAPVTDGWPVLSSAVAVAAVILGHIGLARAPRAGTSRGNGMAITGLILGYLMLAIAVVWLLLKLRYGVTTS